MKTPLVLGSALILGLASAPLYAGHDHNDRAGRGMFYDKARVVDVDPIVEVVQVPTEHRDCWTEEVEHAGRGTDPGAGMVAGTIIGGVIGSHVGRGDGRKAATIAGTIIGAAVGHDMARHSRREPYTSTEHRCRVSNDYYEEERVSGYRVTYRYHGHTFERRMDHDPGKFVQVRVKVMPLD